MDCTDGEGAEVPEASAGSGISNVLCSKATRTPESVMHSGHSRESGQPW